MSSSKPETAVFTTDEPEVIEKVCSAYTGGQATVALQRLYGGNALGCPVFWYLRYFFDDQKESMSASSSVLAETFFAENARAILPGSQNPSSLL